MPIEMPKGLPFSVDTWSPCSKRKRHHFLTHAHKDHSSGISTHFSFPIYSTLITKILVLQHYPQVFFIRHLFRTWPRTLLFCLILFFFSQLDDSLFVRIEVGQSVVIYDPDGVFTVTAFDANHCPGNDLSVLILIPVFHFFV